MVENLILKQTVTKDDGERINSLKLKLIDDGSVQIWLNNGDMWCKIRIDRDQAKWLELWLQRNIK